MKIVILLLITLTCCVIFFLFFLSKRNTQLPRNKKDKVRSQGFSAPALKKEAAPQALNVPDKPLDRIGPLRTHVLDGINNILSSYILEDQKSPLPLQRPEIKPDIVAKVKSHV